MSVICLDKLHFHWPHQTGDTLAIPYLDVRQGEHVFVRGSSGSGKTTAALHLGVPASTLEHLDRVLEQFETYCTVTQSVGQGIAIELQVFDSTGLRLK